MKNKILHRLISLVLVISTLMSFSGFFSAYASSNIKKGYITDDNVFVRKSPTTTKDNKLKHNGSNIMLDTGHEVSIIETVDSDGESNYKTWHQIKFKYDGIEFEGYVYANFVRVVETPSGDIELPEDVPEIYKEYIENLAKSHPNWKFKFYDTGIEWSTLISDNAQGDRKKSMIYKTFPLSYRSTESGCYNWATDTWIATDSGGWYHATDKTIFHYMDPRNFLNENNIFMFEALSYDEKTQTFKGHPTLGDEGNYRIKVYALDDMGNSAVISFNIIVENTYIHTMEYKGLTGYRRAKVYHKCTPGLPCARNDI